MACPGRELWLGLALAFVALKEAPEHATGSKKTAAAYRRFGIPLANSKFSEMPPGPVLKQRRGTMMGVRCPLAVRAPTLGRQYNRLKSTAGDLTRSVSWGGDARRGDFRPVEFLGR